MESVTYLKNQKISPKKLRFLLPQFKKLNPSDALVRLSFMHQKPAKILLKAIKSAVSNAKQTLKVTEDLLQFRVLSVDQGHVLKRYNPGSRGTAMPYKKRFAHIKIVLYARSHISPQPAHLVHDRVGITEGQEKEAVKKIKEEKKEVKKTVNKQPKPKVAKKVVKK